MRLSALVGSACFAVAGLSCGGSDLVLPSETGPADITLEAGNNQKAPAGEALAESLVVKVIDRRGQPLSSQKVAFSLESQPPGALITPDTAETAADGIAKAQWVLGSTSGIQTALARVVGADGLEITFTATVGAGPAARLEAAGGDDQSAPIGTALRDPLSVRVTDAFGNPVADVEVDWSAQQGSVDPETSFSGEDGRATTSWTLGSSTGSQAASASSVDLDGSPVEFTATGRAGSASQLERVSGNNQSARAGSEVPEALVVRLLDQAGNGVPNRAVSWLVATGGGSVPAENTTTDDDGRASTRWTLGPNPGGNTLNAVVSGVGAVAFSATGTSSGGGGGGGGSGASRLVFAVQPSDTEEDRRIEPPVRVAVLNQSGILVTQGEFEVTLELVGDGQQGRGQLDGPRRQQTQFGIATFEDLRVKRSGDFRLRALSDGLPSVESNEFEVQDD
jgi:protocatechuate 3,4-dioxygenase beta subunit